MRAIIIALGGNAIDRTRSLNGPNERIGYKKIKDMARMFKDDQVNIALTHGNGPQVGNELIRNEYSNSIVPGHPLYLINAITQATIGAEIEENLRSGLMESGSRREVETIITHVIVDKMKVRERPTKQIGPFYHKDDMDWKSKNRKEYVRQGDYYRRVVPSPKPVSIVEIEAIRTLFEKGDVVISCGGGGIPVYRKGTGYIGAEGVIDKDLATQVLATSLDAERMIILTDKEYVYNDFPKYEKPIKKIRVGEIKRRIRGFEEGTMKPKIEACVSFLEKGGKEAVIGSMSCAESVMEGLSGTRITR